MSYQLVEDLQKKAFPKVTVSQACRVLEVSRSSYYANVAVHKQCISSAWPSQRCVLSASTSKRPLQPATKLTVVADCERPWLSVASPWADTGCAL